ncbi:MAG: hypothetical protein IJ702_04285 [Fretibacterium sp.]|nr:hypothetical protein [Fretibacterium sp.]
MKSMKKSVIAVLVIGMLSAAGMAFAQPAQGGGQYSPMGPAPHHMGIQRGYEQGFCGHNFGKAQGPAFGRQGRGEPCGWQRGMFAPNRLQGFRGRGFGRGRGPAFGNPGMRGPRGGWLRQNGRFFPNMPQEIRSKAVEAAKLRIDLEDVLSQGPLNRGKAVELNGKISKLEQEIRDWRFDQKLGRIEKFNKKSAEESGKAESEEKK